MNYQPGNPQGGPGGYNPYNPYNPYNSPLQPMSVSPKGEAMATASLVLGIISLISLLFLQITIPFLLGGTSIILAILSRGGAKKILGKAKAGLICSVSGLALSVLFVVFAIWLAFVLPNRSPAFREQINKACEEEYGVSYDELMEDIYDMWNGSDDIWDDLNY